MAEITEAELDGWERWFNPGSGLYQASSLSRENQLRLIAELRQRRSGQRWNEVGPEVAEALRGLVYAWEQDEGCICVANTDDDPCAYCTAVAAIAKAKEITDKSQLTPNWQSKEKERNNG